MLHLNAAIPLSFRVRLDFLVGDVNSTVFALVFPGELDRIELPFEPFLVQRKNNLLDHFVFGIRVQKLKNPFVVTFPLATRLGSQFMPALFEGSTLYMPTALPGISIDQGKVLLQEQDRILRSFPEVASVFGAVGRSDSATDNAPLDIFDTTLMLKPREQWPAGMTYEKLISAVG